MKFDALYKKIYEQEGGVPNPNDIKVEPAPVPTSVQPVNGEIPPSADANGAAGAKTLIDYVTLLDNAIDALNGTETDSLQRLLKVLDKQGTAFEGISDELWHEINRAAESIVGVTTMLKGYINLYAPETAAAPAPAPEQPIEQ